MGQRVAACVWGLVMAAALAYGQGSTPSVVDLAKDPGERKDVAYLHPDVTRELARLYGEWEMIFKNNPPPKVIA